MTRYWTRVSRELWEARADWKPVEGWRVVVPEQTRYPTGGLFSRRMLDALVEDDGALEALEGHLVDVGFEVLPGADLARVAYRIRMD